MGRSERVILITWFGLHFTLCKAREHGQAITRTRGRATREQEKQVRGKLCVLRRAAFAKLVSLAGRY
jgi:hypothetical protein